MSIIGITNNNIPTSAQGPAHIQGGAVGSTQINWPVGGGGQMTYQALDSNSYNSAADIIINGQSLGKWMEKVNDRLLILEPNLKLMAKYESLQAAYDHYKTLEALLHDASDS